MTGRMATLLTTLGAATVVLSTIAARPVPRYLWNASRSVPIGLYRAAAHRQTCRHPSLSRSSRLNLWQHSSQIAAICRAAFPC